jgi:hypothetical protein
MPYYRIAMETNPGKIPKQPEDNSPYNCKTIHVSSIE